MMPPWTDAAVLVLLDNPQGRMIVAEGTSRQMATRVAARPPSEWHRYLVSLPDRAVPPFAFAAEEFADLIDAMKR